MKKLVFASFLTLIAFSNFGFISDTALKKTKKHPCSFIYQLQTSGDCPFSNTNESKKAESPLSKIQGSECPFLKGEVKKGDSKSCPYTGKNDSRNTNSEQKVKTLEIDFS